MAINSPDQKPSQQSRSETDATRNAAAEKARIANIASQLSAEDLEQLRQYIDRHHPKPFQ
jgi:hypothetical protein